MKFWIYGIAMVMLCALPVLAQNTLRVPEEYTTIQEAVNAAIEGDTILIGPGTYCGANVTRRLTILGEGQPRPTITETGCGTVTTGLNLIGNAGGSVIQRLSFSDITQGIAMNSVSDITITHNSFSNVFIGIGGVGTDYITIEHNTITMESGFGGILSLAKKTGSTGNFWTVRYNDISVEVLGLFGGIGPLTSCGWTISHNNLTGAGLNPGILIGNARDTRAVNNIAEFNYIEGAVNGVGIGIYGQDNTVVMNNRIFMPSDSASASGGVGIQIAETGTAYKLSAINSAIMNNDTRGTAVGVMVLPDKLGGTGNSIGNQLRGNFGTFTINCPGSSCITGEVKNRSMSTLITCDENGICSNIP
jgi:hypothetical protein